MWSFIHVADAAEATVAALERGRRGVYNIVDDEPAPVAVWLPELARMLDVRRPMRVPRFVGRLFAGETGDVMMTQLRGASNAKARRGASAGSRHTPAGGRGSPRDLALVGLASGRARPTAFAIAYRMLGSVAEAEDVVQEALLRVHQTLEAGEEIASPRAFVATVTTRLAINEPARPVSDASTTSASGCRSRSSRMGRPTRPSAPRWRTRSPWHCSSRSRASPEQRAVLLLHDVFGYGYDEITGIVGTTEGNARQLALRARRQVKERRPRFTTTREHQEELAPAGSSPPRRPVTSPGSKRCSRRTSSADRRRGGKAPAMARTLRGRSRVARTVLSWARLGARLRRSRCAACRSTAGRARSSTTPRSVLAVRGRSRSPAARSPASARSSTPTSSPPRAGRRLRAVLRSAR